MLSNFVAAVGITIIAAILGIAGQVFGVGQSQGMWLMTAFMLTYASFMPIVGRISDNYGSRKVFMASIVTFAVGSLISSLFLSFPLIILGRAVQGLGAAGVLPVANAIVSRRFPKEKGKYLALVNATYGLGMVAGINIGGITFDALGWRWMFILTAIASGVAVLLSAIWLKDPDGDEDRVRHPVDVAGSALFAISVAAFMLLFRAIGNDAASSAAVVIWTAVLVVALVLFILRERSVSYPAVDLSMFRRPAYLTYNLVAFCFGIGMFVLTTMLPTFGQALVGFGVSQSVYAVDPFAAGMIVFTMASAPLIRRFGPRPVLFAGGLAFAAATLLLAIFTFGEVGFYVNTILVSIGLGLCMTPMNYIVIEAGGDRNEGSSAGMVSVMRSLGGVIGPTIAGLIMSRIDYSSLFVMDNILGAYSNVFLMAFIAVVVMTALSVIGMVMRKRPFKEASI